MTADYDSLRARLHSIEQVVPLLEAMRSVAEITFRRAEERLDPLARYTDELDAQIDRLRPAAASAPAARSGSAGSILLLVISSERGLCGSFNRLLIERVVAWLRERRAAGADVSLACLGRQGQRFLAGARELLVYHASLPSFALPTYLDIERIALEVLDLMESRHCDRLVVTHSRPLTRFRYEVASRQLFPLEPARPGRAAAVAVKPAADAPRLFLRLTTERVLVDLYRAVIESAISEELARIAAMRLAKDNASRLIEGLSIDANRARQNAETNALLEIISGFQAAAG